MTVEDAGEGVTVFSGVVEVIDVAGLRELDVGYDTFATLDISQINIPIHIHRA